MTSTSNVPVAVVLRDDNGTLSNLDDDFTPTFLGGDTNNNGLLDPGETWIYRTTSTAVVGPYRNIATATATLAATGQSALDADPAHYFSPTAAIRIEKAVNATDPANPTAIEDADTEPGRVLVIGTPLVWTYLVHNDGTDPIDVFGVMDDHGTPSDANDDFEALAVLDAAGFNVGDLNGNNLLDPGEAWQYTSDGIVFDVVVAGQYTNLGKVTGVIAGVSVPVDDTDPANHIGSPSGINVVKYVNGEDANTPAAAVYVKAGTVVTWTFEVTLREGVAPLHDVVLVDDQGTTNDPSDDASPRAARRRRRGRPPRARRGLALRPDRSGPGRTARQPGSCQRHRRGGHHVPRRRSGLRVRRRARHQRSRRPSTPSTRWPRRCSRTPTPSARSTCRARRSCGPTSSATPATSPSGSPRSSTTTARRTTPATTSSPCT